jgi:PhoH-like ATPase
MNLWLALTYIGERMYSGVSIVQVGSELINRLYSKKEIKLSEVSCFFPALPKQNEYIILKSFNSQSAIGRVKGNKIILINEKISIEGFKPRNAEQTMALNALLDDSIQAVGITGRAGSGKSFLAYLAAMTLIQDKKYNRIIIARNASSVGRGIGFLPGDSDQKVSPYLEGFFCNVENILGGNKRAIEDFVEQYRVEFKPISLIRGGSYNNSFIIVEEVQNLTNHEFNTVGTRVGEGSKIVFIGDLNQIDERINKEQTGIMKFANSEISQESEIVAFINLIKCERGPVSKIIGEVFE